MKLQVEVGQSLGTGLEWKWHLPVLATLPPQHAEKEQTEQLYLSHTAICLQRF